MQIKFSVIFTLLKIIKTNRILDRSSSGFWNLKEGATSLICSIKLFELVRSLIGRGRSRSSDQGEDYTKFLYQFSNFLLKNLSVHVHTYNKVLTLPVANASSKYKYLFHSNSVFSHSQIHQLSCILATIFSVWPQAKHKLFFNLFPKSVRKAPSSYVWVTTRKGGVTLL